MPGIAACLLVACGGGGDGGDPGAAMGPPPATGAFAWLLKADGSTSRLRYGLSLIHPQSPEVEYVVEPASAAVTEARLVSSGAVDMPNARVASLQPYALLYIVGGDVRRVSLQANGQAPASRVVRAATTSACSIVLEAVDHAAPEQSRFVVSTAGADGSCGSADDGRAEVRFDAALGLVFTPLTADLPLAVLRDPATLAPRGWISARSAVLWSPAPTTTVPLRSATDPVIERVVSSSYRSAVVESGGGLALLDFPGGSTFSETTLPGASGTGWESIGFDAASHYLYRNTGTGVTAIWQVLKVGRQAPISTTLASGAGEVALASMGTSRVFVSVLGASGNTLLAFDKASFAAPQVLESLPSTAIALVSTSGAGVHQLWRVTGLGSGTISYTVEMIDEAFNKVYVAATGGFPLAMAEATAIDYARSENRSTFLFATGYGDRAFGDAALVAYDAALRTATPLGALPGQSAFGADMVFASVVSSPATGGAGFAGRSVGGVVQSADAKVFSFDTGTANSLKTTTTQR